MEWKLEHDYGVQAGKYVRIFFKTNVNMIMNRDVKRELNIKHVRTQKTEKDKTNINIRTKL